MDFREQPTFRDGVSQIISKGDHETLRYNAIALDRASLVGRAWFPNNVEHLMAPFASSDKNGEWLWSGAQLILPNMVKQITINGYLQRYNGNDGMRVTIAGTSQTPITTDGAFSVTYSITGNVGDVIPILVQKYSPSGSPGYGQYWIDEVYSPLAAVSMPTLGSAFAGTYDAARLNSLPAVAQALYTRISRTPMPLSPGMSFRYLAAKVVSDYEVLSGTIRKNNSNDVWRFTAQYWPHQAAGATEYLDFYLNGALNTIRGPYTGTGPHTVTAAISLSSLSVGAYARIEVRQRITAGATGSVPTPSRIFVYQNGTEADGGGYAYATPPPTLTGNVAPGQTAFDAAWNGVRSVLSGVTNRLDGNAALWNRAYATRHVYVMDGQVTRGKLRAWYAHATTRVGDTLVVSGTGPISLCWGGVTPGSKTVDGKDGSDAEEVPNYFERKDANSVTVIEGGKTETRTVFLDSIEGLFVGDRYYLVAGQGGQVNYASEFDS